MRAQRSTPDELILGLVSISDRASRGEYQDEGIPALQRWCEDAITSPFQVHKRLIADDRYTIEETLRELVDRVGCDLVFTTGGTGPALRDVTPEATIAVGTREMPGFAEQMRRISLNFVPTAILSRQVAVLREIPGHAALIVNLPGRPKSISETLGGFRSDDGEVIDAGIFASIPYCIDLIGGPYIETNPDVIEAFRPKNARRTQTKLSDTPTSTPTTSLGQSSIPESSDGVSYRASSENTEPQTATTSVGKTQYYPIAEDEPESMFAEERRQAALREQQLEQARAQEQATRVAKELRADNLRPDFGLAPGQKIDRIPTGLAMSPAAIARRSVQHGVALVGANQHDAIEPLEFIVKEPDNGIPAPCTVIWLHGLGTDAHDFEPFPRQILDFGGPNARYIFPNAPELMISAHNGYRTRAWFDLLTDKFQDSPEDLVGLKRMHLRLSMIINSIISSGQRAERIFLGGFSQGAAMALYCGLRQARTLGGVIALSGYLPAAELMRKEITSAGRATPVFMAHGAFDSVINPTVAKQSADIVESLVNTLIWREYNMDHELCPDEITHIAQFMNTALEP